MDNDMEEDAKAEDLGIDISSTMKLQVRVKDRTLVALVDTGSTHTFIREAVATQLGLQVTPSPGLSVKVANGDNITGSGIYSKLQIAIAEETFHVTCYGLPLAGFNIVLGVQWLRSLGPILWNFNALSMEFWRLGRKVRWVGLGAPHTQCAALYKPRELLHALL
jgi:hypothetical protein